MRDREKELMRFDRPALEDALRQAGADFVSGTNMICCPFHADTTPSASIHQDAKDSHWAIRCFTCGETWDYFDVLAKAKGVTVGELLKESAPSNGHERARSVPSGPGAAQTPPQETQDKAPRPVGDLAAVKAIYGGAYRAHYAYTDPATGKIDLLAVRFMAVTDPVTKKLVPNATGTIKDFRQLHAKVKGGPFFFGGPDGAHPLYNRTRMLKADEILVVEGEKDVHTLTALGFTATTWPGGAQSTHAVDWSPLAGKKRVVLWPDNDVPGMKAMDLALKGIQALASPPLDLASIIPADIGLGPVLDAHGKDVTDFLEEFYPNDKSEVKAAGLREVLYGQVQDLSPAGRLMAQYEDVFSGKRQCWHFCHDEATHLTQALLPATNTLINGSPGHGKSLYLQQVMLALHEAGVPIAYLHLEYQLTTHMRRAHAQLADASRLSNEEWVRYNPSEVRRLYDSFRDQLNSFGTCLTCLEKRPTQAEALEWVKRQAAAGKKVIAIDPNTKIKRPTGSYTPDADDDFVDELAAIGKAYDCSLIIVTHPKASPFRAATDFLSNMAGGAAWERFSQTVFFLEYLKDPLIGVQCDFHGQKFPNSEDEPISRVLHICKANNGTGNGICLGYYFNPKTLRYKEMGRLQRNSKGKWK